MHVSKLDFFFFIFNNMKQWALVFVLMILSLWLPAQTTSVQVVKEINASGSASTRYLIKLGGVVLFSATDGINGTKMWSTDGSSANTVLVDLNANNPLYFTESSPFVYFNASSVSTNGAELWKTNGTTAGTSLVKDISAGAGSFPTDLINVNGILFFTADDGISGRELWKSDGTTNGTVLVKDITPGPASSQLKFFVTTNNKLCFTKGNTGVFQNVASLSSLKYRGSNHLNNFFP
ncbi:MAG: hypothetical protein K2U26_07535, partial [Cyclobacteriaceae bacterium]|nr:hypothetical protein [Cyclobacteriaceae bacterium]